MKKTSSMCKDSSNRSRSRFGCYFRRRLVNFKNLKFFLGTFGLCMVQEKIKRGVVFYSEHIKNDS